MIEGYFQVANKTAVIAFLEQHELDVDTELVIRREIAPNGKSRAFINDTPASLQQLKELASLLVDLHQQFDTLSLGDTDFQRNVLDALAGNQTEIAKYQSVYQELQITRKELDSLEKQKAAFHKELDYHQFLYDELAEIALKENELETLEAELQLLSHAEGIKSTLSRVHFELNGSEQPILPLFKQWINQLHAFANYHPAMQSIIERLQSSQIELQDIADEMDQLNNKIQLDEKRVDQINERMAEGYKLLKKHSVKASNELIAIQFDLSNKIQAVLQLDDTILLKQTQTATLLQSAQQIAKKISLARHQQSKPLEKAVNALLVQVGMPNARLQLRITDQALQNFGQDQIEFLFDANNSNRFEPIRKVASGGELSRLMLCIKSLVAQSVDLATLIFDEIDTGISGEAAKQVGRIMKNLSTNRQIICITHQAQIAGKADAHFYVYKENQGDKIKTNLRLLTHNERINTIASMLSGEAPTAAAIENAKEMMQD